MVSSKHGYTFCLKQRVHSLKKGDYNRGGCQTGIAIWWVSAKIKAAYTVDIWYADFSNCGDE